MKGIKNIRKAVATLAHQLTDTLKVTQSESWAWAWYIVKENMEDCILIQFVKKSGEEVKRIVTRKIEKFYSFKDDTKRTAKAGLNKFIDLGKYAKKLITGSKSTLFTSCYEFETL